MMLAYSWWLWSRSVDKAQRDDPAFRRRLRLMNIGFAVCVPAIVGGIVVAAIVFHPGAPSSVVSHYFVIYGFITVAAIGAIGAAFLSIGVLVASIIDLKRLRSRDGQRGDRAGE